MRTLLVIIILAALVWSAYWAIGAQRAKAGVKTWLTEKNDAGFDIHVEDVSIWGFPNRFDITMAPLRIQEDEWGFAWRGAFFQILRLSYDSDHAIFIFPERHELKLDDIDFKISSDRMRASSVKLEDGSHRFVLEAENLSLKNEKQDLRFVNAQLAFLLRKDQSKLQLRLMSEDTQSPGKPDSLLLLAVFSSDRALADEDLAFFDVKALSFKEIKLILNERTIYKGLISLTFAELLDMKEMRKALDEIVIN